MCPSWRLVYDGKNANKQANGQYLSRGNYYHFLLLGESQANLFERAPKSGGSANALTGCRGRKMPRRGQVVKVEPNPEVSFAKFTALVFHPDLLSRTALGRQMNRYEFFSYSSTEALHLSAQEVEVFRGVLAMIEQELHRAIDKHTRELIVSNIELLLNYCLRFYDRQFITREEINHSVVKKFLDLLDDYIASKAQSEGLPTVAYFADKCCLSSGYFGNLVRVETGRTAKDIIADRLLAHAKQLLNDDTLTITMISERMGFDYPQHFVRFFKSHTGKTPSAFRKVS